MNIPSKVDYLIVGAGIHGLSTAWHLAKALERTGKGSGKDVLVVDKTSIGAGASGIACGIVRNNYFQPAMRELMAHSVGVWEEDGDGYGYHPVGYLQISCEVMHSGVAQIYEEQKAIGYPSTFIEGERDCLEYMRKNIFEDWQAEGITSVLHEKKGGFAHNTKSLNRLAEKAEAMGVRILTNLEVTGFSMQGEAVSAVETARGKIDVEQVVVAPGPWASRAWKMLGLPEQIAIKGRNGQTHTAPMWTHLCLVEGTLGVDPHYGYANGGARPPVVHVDSDAPLRSSEDGSILTEENWGIYYKPDAHFGGIQGGSAPYQVEEPVAIDPYGVGSKDYVVGPDFVHMWTSALAHCQKRYEGKHGNYKNVPSGGIGAFTPDCFPIFDTFKTNCTLILDSNHGYKMIGVGALIAEELLGDKQSLLEPFRFARFARGALHPESASPFPWS